MFTFSNEVKALIRNTISTIADERGLSYGGGIINMDGSDEITLDKAISYGLVWTGERKPDFGENLHFYVLTTFGYQMAFELGYMSEYDVIAYDIEADKYEHGLFAGNDKRKADWLHVRNLHAEVINFRYSHKTKLSPTRRKFWDKIKLWTSDNERAAYWFYDLNKEEFRINDI